MYPDKPSFFDAHIEYLAEHDRLDKEESEILADADKVEAERDALLVEKEKLLRELMLRPLRSNLHNDEAGDE